MAHLLALDQGTTSSRAIVYDERLVPVASAQQEFEQHFPKPGWVEHEPDDLWDTQLAVARRALDQAGIAATDFAGIGITNQRETTVLWERDTGKPVGRAIVWQDRRTAPRCRELREAGHEPLIRKRTGLLADAYFSGTKLAWLLAHHDAHGAARDGKLCFGTVDSWLIHRLTGGKAHRTDATNASRTMLFDIHRQRWDADLLDMLGIPEAVLPEVLPCDGAFGTVDLSMLGAKVSITGVAGDQQAAMFGQACIQPGQAKNTYGTGCFLLLHTGERAVRSDNRLLTTIAARLGDRTTYALEGSVFVGGAVVQWLRDHLGLVEHSPQIEPLARQVDDSDGVVMVPAFTGLGAPHWDSDARGLIIGLTRGTGPAHLARAALDSIAHQSADLLDAMAADMQAAGLELTELRVDGGAAANDLLMQTQADLLGVPVVRPADVESTARGAAALAGLGCGLFESPVQIAELWQADRRFEPAGDAPTVRAQRQQWAEAVRRCGGWAAG
jgi:glycerol kinase